MPNTGRDDDSKISEQQERENLERASEHILAAIYNYRTRHPDKSHLSNEEILKLIAQER